MAFLKNAFGAIGAVAKDAVNIGVNAVRTPIAAVQGKPLPTANTTTGIGSIAGKITGFTTSLQSQLAAPVVRGIIGGGNAQQLAASTVGSAKGVFSQPIQTMGTSSQTAAAPAPVTIASLAPQSPGLTTIGTIPVAGQEKAINEVVNAISKGIQVTAPEIKQMTGESEKNWFVEMWEKIVAYSKEKPAIFWSIIAGVVAVTGGLIYYFSTNKKGRRRSYRRF